VQVLFATREVFSRWAGQVVLAAGVLLFPVCGWALSVAFINPGKADEAYWVTVTQAMQAAASKLGIALEVTYLERDHAKAVEVARDLAGRPSPRRPDYVLLGNEGGFGPPCLRILDGAGIPVLMVFSGISDLSQRKLSGAPREKYKLWLGTLEPRAEDAGYLTAKALIEKGRAAAWAAPGERLHMVALSGDKLTPSSLLRAQGMRRAVAEAGDVVLEQEIFSGFGRERAAQQMPWLLQRYPKTRLVWAGNDLMAFGAMDAVRSRNLIPGQDVLFSGINTSPQALDALLAGELSALAGGHFMLGAWGLVLVYDHHHGRDFALTEGLEMVQPMFSLFSPQQAARFSQLYGDGRFGAIDFKHFSKFHNPQLKRYNFSFAQLLGRKG
jgi:ABC-type sugar transport system substrate-binding protein